MRKISPNLIVLTSLLSGAAAASHSAELTQAEVSNLIGIVQKCWNPPSGAGGKVTVKFKLNRSGAVIGTPEASVEQDENKEADLLAAAAKRAVLRCQPYRLPADKYDSWSEVVIHFATD